MGKDSTKLQSWTEHKLQQEVIKYCRSKFGWDIRTPAGTPGIRDGSPDYIIPVENKVLFIEFKSPMKTSTVYRPFQEETIMYLRSIGHVAFATKCYDTCIKVIDSREYDSMIIESDTILLEEIVKK